jgi:hypothetical protein
VPLPPPLDPEDMEGIAVEVQGLGLKTSDRIAILGENRTCGVDEGGSVLGLRVGGLMATAPFEKWEPKVLTGGGIGQLYTRVAGRACPNNEKKKLPNPSKYKDDPEGEFNHWSRAVTTGNKQALATTSRRTATRKGRIASRAPSRNASATASTIRHTSVRR